MKTGAECVVIGAGVVGLAVARALALTGREVIVLEANRRIGEETSARNNEVIHAGFLYPAGTLKAMLCRPGRDMLYEYCASRGIPHRRLPKLMPAIAESEVAALHKLVEQGRAAGVDDLAVLDTPEATALEPAMRCHGMLISPSTGIVDSHMLMLALQGDLETHGGVVALGSAVVAGRIGDGGCELQVVADGARTQVACDVLINAAGLGAETIARQLEGYPQTLVPKVHFAKGEFQSCSGRVPFRHLVVPLGDTLAQGGALTLDLAGATKFGPDLSFVETRDYAMAANKSETFATAVRRYWPEMAADRLSAGYAGIRPRITGPGEPPGDWQIDGPERHGVAGLVHMFGVDTPGLTACLSLADHVIHQIGAGAPQPKAA